MSRVGETTSLLPHRVNDEFDGPIGDIQLGGGDSYWDVVVANIRGCFNVCRIVRNDNILINMIVFLIPAIIAGQLGANEIVLFILGFLAIIPLAAMLGFGTNVVAKRCGNTIGGLLNVSFGNMPELLVAYEALKRGNIRLVQVSMIGSILSNTLLVLGCSILAAAFYGQPGKEQRFNNVLAAGSMGNLMLVASSALVFSSAFAYAILPSTGALVWPVVGQDPDSIVKFSHSAAILMLTLYGYFLYFSLVSHKEVFDGNSEHEDSTEAPVLGAPNGEEEETISIRAAIILMLISLVFIDICAGYLVGSLDAVVATGWVSAVFVGMILIPIVGNAAEHSTAIVQAKNQNLDLAIDIAVGSSTQISLFAIPVCVIMGWFMGQPMTLHFEMLDTVLMFVATLLDIFLLQDGSTNMLEGHMCIVSYAFIALIYFHYPEAAKP